MNYLAKTAHVKTKYVPYYLKWVADCYAFFDLPNSQPVSNDHRKQFLKHISKSYEEWQVKQADAALRLNFGVRSLIVHSRFLIKSTATQNLIFQDLTPFTTIHHSG